MRQLECLGEWQVSCPCVVASADCFGSEVQRLGILRSDVAGVEHQLSLALR